MGLETPADISEFNTDWPLDGDVINQGDNHIRNMKTAIKVSTMGVAQVLKPLTTDANGITSGALFTATFNQFDVDFWGADPTGATDSRAAIQNCIDNAPDYSTIHFPGTYRIDSGLEVYDRIGIILAGPGSLTAHSSWAPGAYNALTGAVGNPMVHIKGTDHAGHKDNGIDRLTLHCGLEATPGNPITNYAPGIAVESTRNCRISNCDVNHFVGYGIMSIVKAGALMVHYNQFSEFFWGEEGWETFGARGAHGMSIHTADGMWTENIVSYCAICCYVGDTTSNVWNFQILGNHFFTGSIDGAGNDDPLLYLDDSANQVICIGNYFDNGHIVYRGNHCTIKDSLFIKTATSGTTVAVHLYANAVGDQKIGCTITGNLSAMADFIEAIEADGNTFGAPEARVYDNTESGGQPARATVGIWNSGTIASTAWADNRTGNPPNEAGYDPEVLPSTWKYTIDLSSYVVFSGKYTTAVISWEDLSTNETGVTPLALAIWKTTYGATSFDLIATPRPKIGRATVHWKQGFDRLT